MVPWIWQGDYRRNLLEKFKKNYCAIIGLSPEQSLEEDHLYSYTRLDLHGRGMRVKIGKNEKKWLKLHWERFAEK